MNDKYMEAKKLFIKYGYSGYVMSRESFDEDYKIYKEYEAPKELELEWAHEYQDKLEGQIYLSKNNRELLYYFIKFFTNVRYNLEYGNLSKVIKILCNIEGKIDSFTKERIAGIVINYIGKNYIQKNIVYDNEVIDLEDLVVKWLNEIVSEPITVDQSYLDIIDDKKFTSFFIMSLDPSNIIQDAKNSLIEWANLKNRYHEKS